MSELLGDANAADPGPQLEKRAVVVSGKILTG